MRGAYRYVAAGVILLTLSPAAAFTLGVPLVALAPTHRPVLVRADAAEPTAEPVVEAAEAASGDVVSFTEAALSQLTFMREKQGLDELWIRMGVRAGGCSGMSYIMDVMKADDVDENDTIVKYEETNIACAVDPKSLMFMYGLRLDYSDALIGGGFSFFNPNAESTCGCGKSFGV